MRAMKESEELIRIFREIGTDRYLSLEELPAASGTEDFSREAWEIYCQHFGRFTGAYLDPLFHGIKNQQLHMGRPCIAPGDPVLIVGLGPSLKADLAELSRLQDRFHIFTSNRGAEYLRHCNIIPDLVLLEQATPLDAELAWRHNFARDAALRTGKDPWTACEHRTPGSQISTTNKDRLFVPEICPAWGLWPATAATLAVQSKAGRVGILGIDLGTPAGANAEYRPLSALLGLIAKTMPDCMFDCGQSGSTKPGWNRIPIAEFAGIARSASFDVLTRPGLHADEIVQSASEALDAVNPFIEEAHEGLALAQSARASAGIGRRNDDLRHWLQKLVSWGRDRSTRILLQEVLSLSFLPQLWRSEFKSDMDWLLWRPLAASLNELMMQAERLRKQVGL
jgi:hypothetical protein